MNESVLAYMITWTVYGTFLQGDNRWWNKREHGEMPPQPRLLQWHEQRLKFPIRTLNKFDRIVTESAIEHHATFRGWDVLARNARTNHVHTVIAAQDVQWEKVCDQLKANCTRQLRENDDVWLGRPVWSVGGHCDWITTEEELERAIEYVLFAQDKKHLDLL